VGRIRARQQENALHEFDPFFSRQGLQIQVTPLPIRRRRTGIGDHKQFAVFLNLLQKLEMSAHG
jgi:hypothetical protein